MLRNPWRIHTIIEWLENWFDSRDASTFLIYSVHKNPICTCILLWWKFSFCCLIGFPVAFFWEQKMARVDCFSVDYRCQCFVFSLFFLETRANYLKFMDSAFSCERLSVCFYFFWFIIFVFRFLFFVFFIIFFNFIFKSKFIYFFLQFWSWLFLFLNLFLALL